MASFADLAARLQLVAVAADYGSEAAANDMADVFTRFVQAELSARGHPPHTKTPSPPGSPPAFISGALHDSMLITPAVGGGGFYISRTGPTTRYSRIQELGGEMHAHTEKGMRWQEPPGVWHMSMAHSLPDRPYMLPANRLLSHNGVLSSAAEAAFSAEVYAAE